MTEVAVISAREADFDEIAAFQRRAFRNGWGGRERRRLQCPAYYKWKYSTPFGHAALAVGRGAQGIETMAAAVPFPAQSRHGHDLAWQICDVATAPDMRERGYFHRCIAALRQTVSPGQPLFSFPNHSSYRRFLSAGFTNRGHIPISAAPVRRTREPARRLTPINRFGFAQDELAAQPLKSGAGRILKSARYMNWRYTEHPVTAYACLAHHEHGICAGVIVLRCFSVASLRVAVIVELVTRFETSVSELLAVARQWAAGERAHALVLGGAGTHRNGLQMFELPAWLMPRRISLVASDTRSAAGGEADEEWAPSLGDWDAL